MLTVFALTMSLAVLRHEISFLDTVLVFPEPGGLDNVSAIKHGSIGDHLAGSHTAAMVDLLT